MASEIATAFVRIRPNMAGFQSETQSGVKHAFSGIAKVIGLTLGAAETFSFGKDILSEAASLQKQVETVRAEFGGASAAVLKFGRDGAEALGLSALQADTVSARFGILFKNLGIGGTRASGMAIGLEKLAGSIAAIRGVDPQTVLDRLPLVLAGNVRALKQLGLGIDSSQIKLAALKLGLISSIHDALTPAAKAQAIYALATAHLGTFLQQARKHSGDFANVQRRLSAEWKNAKETLGAALLPTVTKYARELEVWLTRMQKTGRLQRDFNAIAKTTVSIVKGVAQAIGTGWKVWQTATKWIGGTKGALVALFVVLSIQKIRGLASAIVSQLVNNGFKRLRIATEEEKAAYLESFGTMEVATVGLGATIKSALISTGIGALIVAVGIATAWVLTHWDTVKKYTVALANGIAATWNGLKTTLLGIAELIGGGMATELTLPLRAFLELASQITKRLAGVGLFGFHPFAGPNKIVQGALDALKTGTTDLIGKGAENVKKGFSEIGSAFGSAWSKSLADAVSSEKSKARVKDASTQIGKAINVGVTTSVAKLPTNIATTISDAMKLALEAAQQRIRAAIQSAKDNLDKIGEKLAASVNKILDKLGPAGPAGKAQKGAIARLQKLIAEGAPGFAITKAATELSSDLQEAGRHNAQDKTIRHAAVARRIADLTDEFNRGKIDLKTFNRRLTQELLRDKVNVKLAGKELGVAFSDGFREEIKALREQAAAIAAVPRRLRVVGGGGGSADLKIIRPLEVIRRENQIIAGKAAKQRERQIKAQERAAKAAEKTAANTAALKGTKVGSLPGENSKKARDNAKAGVSP